MPFIQFVSDVLQSTGRLCTTSQRRKLRSSLLQFGCGPALWPFRGLCFSSLERSTLKTHTLNFVLKSGQVPTNSWASTTFSLGISWYATCFPWESFLSATLAFSLTSTGDPYLQTLIPRPLKLCIRIAVIKMLIVVVLIFALSWFPLYAITIRVRLGYEINQDWLWPLAQWLGNSNSCSNVITYSFLNQKFRNAFSSIIWGSGKKKKIRVKHKSPTVNILLQRLSNYRVRTTISKNNENSYDSI